MLIILGQGVLRFSNYEWDKVVTPIIIDKSEEMLQQPEYPCDKTNWLVNGFKLAFDIGYREPEERKHTARNLPLKVGSLVEFWNKVMKETQLGCYAGPYDLDNLPFKYYIQSPVGLVPKAGNKTRLIFHLSYHFGPSESESLSTTTYHKSFVL